MRAAYAWLKDTETNLDRCVADPNICIFDTRNKPVMYCAFTRNKDTQICKSQRSAESNNAYRILGCYAGPDCGGNVQMDMNVEEKPFKCPEEELKKCGTEVPMDKLVENCVELEEGTMPSSAIGLNYTIPPYCYIGKSFEKGDSPYYDPCKLSFKNNGVDLVPKACFNRHCCPGSFGNK